MLENRVFGHHFPKRRPNWINFRRDLSLPGVDTWVQFDPDRCMDGFRPNDKDLSCVSSIPMHSERDNVMTILSVCLSVCLSHAGIVSKRMQISSNSSHVWQRHDSGILRPATVTTSQGELPQRGAEYTGVGKICILYSVCFGTEISIFKAKRRSHIGSRKAQDYILKVLFDAG